MKPSTQDRTEGKLHEVKGKIKEGVGKATNDPDLEVSGNAEKKAGVVQKMDWSRREGCRRVENAFNIRPQGHRSESCLKR